MRGISVAAKVKPAKPPKLTGIKVTPVANGFQVAHHFGGLVPPKQFVFSDSKGLLKHVAHTARSVWEGGKTGMPRVRSSMHAHRAKQIETTSY